MRNIFKTHPMRVLACGILLSVLFAAVIFTWFAGSAGDPGGNAGGAEKSRSGRASHALEPLHYEPESSPGDVKLRLDVSRLLDPQTPPRRRIDLAMACDTGLGPAELDALLAEISTLPASGVDIGWHSQYFHEICCQLHKYPAVRENFSRVLTGVAMDERRERIERDYAIQHLRRAWHLSSDDGDLREAIMMRFKSLAHGGHDVSGPAILSLHLLGNTPGTPWNRQMAVISDGELEPLVSGIMEAGNAREDAGSLMAALRIAGDRKLAAPLPWIMDIAADPSFPVAVRMAAVAIVAASGSDTDEFFRSIDRMNPQVDQAVRLSLAKKK